MELEFKTLEVRKIGSEEVNSVSLRELYSDLGYSESNFTTWCKKNLITDFIENQDYITLFLEKKGSTGSTKETNYIEYMHELYRRQYYTYNNKKQATGGIK